VEIITGIHLVDGIIGVNSHIAICGDSILVTDTGFLGSAKKIVQYIDNYTVPLKIFLFLSYT
jgi:hypothetical protein